MRTRLFQHHGSASRQDALEFDAVFEIFKGGTVRARGGTAAGGSWTRAGMGASSGGQTLLPQRTTLLAHFVRSRSTVLR